MRTFLRLLIIALFVIASFSGATWAGSGPERPLLKTWDKSNIDQVKDLLPPSDVMRVKEWGLTIPEFKYVPWISRGSWKEATEKYSKQCKIDENGILRGWDGGTPFPNTKKLEEMMWNYKKMNNGDDRYCDEDLYLNSFKRGEKKVRVKYTNYKMIGRVQSPPVPDVPNNPQRNDFKRMTFITDPFELRGFGTLEYSYEDERKESDFWIYIPSLRRVRRASAASRQDTWDGTELIIDDFDGFSGKTIEHTYKLIGEKEMLVPNDVLLPFKKDERQPLFWTYAKTPVYVIEAIPKDPNYVYSKRIFYLQKDGWNLAGTEIYDKTGKLWKYLCFPTMAQGSMDIKEKGVTSQHGNPDVQLAIGGWSCDFILGHSTFFNIDQQWYDTNKFPEKNYETSFLKETGK